MRRYLRDCVEVNDSIVRVPGERWGEYAAWAEWPNYLEKSTPQC